MKRYYKIFAFCALIAVVALAGYSIGIINNKNLPVVESTTIYPEFDMPSLTNTATYIVRAKVENVGDTILKELPVSLTENPEESTETISYPVTPITLHITDFIKGNTDNQTLIYYEDGGTTSSYIQLPNGYSLDNDMDIILFLNEDGYCWGEQSMFPVIDNKVILNEMAVTYIDANLISTVPLEEVSEINYRNQIKKDTVSTMDIDDFTNTIRALE